MRFKGWVCVLLIIAGCEKPYLQHDGFTGSWHMDLVMSDNGEQIGKIEGVMTFYADNIARLTITNTNTIQQEEYTWFQKNNHLLLNNTASDFILPYRIDNVSEGSIFLSQSEQIQITLVRL